MTMLRLPSDDRFFPFSRDPPVPKTYDVMLLLIYYLGVAQIE